MRPPLAGKRAAARRVAEEVRRRLEPVERVLPVRLPQFVPGERPREDAAPAPADDEVAPADAAAADAREAPLDDARGDARETAPRAARADARDPPAPGVPGATNDPQRTADAAEAAARIDAARERLRASIESPAEDSGPET